MEIFKQIFLMILKQIIEMMAGGLSSASTQVEAKLAAKVAKNYQNPENSSPQQDS